jgi:hypothetical protein
VHAKDTGAPVANSRDNSANPDRVSPHLAIVEDEDPVRALIVDAVAENGYEID